MSRNGTSGVVRPSWIARPSLEAVALWGGLALVLWLIGYATLPGLGRNYDFRAFYCAGQLVQEAPAKLYDLQTQYEAQNAIADPHGALPFYHPAYEALLFAPLSLLSYRGAYFVFLGLNLLALGACYLIAPSDGALKPWRAGFLFLFGPVLLCLVFGQDSILFLFLLCVVWQILRAGRDVAAGVVLALALFKLSVVPVIAVLLCLRRGWRFTTGFFSMAVILALACVGITGVTGSVEFIHLLARATLVRDGSVGAQNSLASFPALMPTVHGLLYVTLGHLLTPRVFVVTYGAVSAALLVVGMIVARRATEVSVAFCTAILCGVLLSPHLYGYDFTVLLLPMLLLKNRCHVVVAWGCFAAAPILMNPSAVRIVAWAVLLPAVLLIECVDSQGEKTVWAGASP